ncbi:MAG: hypothetical protein HYS22_07735 [Deltaproteobacteria bacterium]|nr:hypothetical protein [Deltaproteobacteria bacterium]
MKQTFLFFAVLLTLFSACGGSSETDATDDTITGTLTSLQTNLFTPTCALSGCHSSSSQSGSLSLAAGESFGSLVGTAANELPSMNRVTANDTTKSYLIHKLEGTQSSAGGSGSRMPLGGSALTEAEIQATKDWINSGAKNN